MPQLKPNDCYYFVFIIIIAIGSYLLLLKKVRNARLGESDLLPISPKTPDPQYQPRERKN